MKTNEYIQIWKEFKKVDSKNDFFDLLNFVYKLKYKNENVNLSRGILNYNLYDFRADKYRNFEIPKKNGKTRLIHSPNKSLRIIQDLIKEVVISSGHISQSAQGFAIGRSIVSNAACHVNKDFVLNVDIKNFFHSFDQNAVKIAFMKEPFNLKGNKEPLAWMLSLGATHEINVDGVTRRVLPMGSPLSPVLTNVLCFDLDRRLSGLSRRFKLFYSRYADDLTFSGAHNPLRNETFLLELERLLMLYNLKLNSDKTRLFPKNDSQLVTGLLVNNKVNLNKNWVKKLRSEIYLLHSYGIQKSLRFYNLNNSTDLKSYKYLIVLKGKLNYLSMIKGKNSVLYKNLTNRYNKALNENITRDSEFSRDELYDSLDLLLKHGLGAGLNKLYHDRKE